MELYRDNHNKAKNPADEKDPFRFIRLALVLVSNLGRMPFSISKDPAYGRICMKRKIWWMQLDFIFLLTILSLLVVLLGSAIFRILFFNQDFDIATPAGQDQ